MSIRQMKQSRQLSTLTEMSIGPLWLLRSSRPVTGVDVTATAIAEATLPEPLAEQRTESLAESYSDASSEHVALSRHCPVCHHAWLESSDQDSDVLVILAAPIEDERERQLLERSLWAAGWKQPQVFFSMHAMCTGAGAEQADTAAVSMTQMTQMAQAALQAQITKQQPDMVLVFGALAAQQMGLEQAQRGKRGVYANTPMVVTCHPAELIATPLLKAELWADLCLARHGS